LKFVIFAPSYSADSGGSIVLHRLADLIVREGHDAYLVPIFENRQISLMDWQARLSEIVFDIHNDILIRRAPALYATNPNYLGCVLNDNVIDFIHAHNCIVIYPEIVFGNPLKAKHIARWILNTPGVISNSVCFSPGEVQFRYSDRFEPIYASFLEIADFNLQILDVPWQQYVNRNPTGRREGAAFMERKGVKVEIPGINLANAVKIDGMSHEKIAKVFSEVEFFYSFDISTLYSQLAAISGVKSVLLAETQIEQPGIANGIADLIRASETLPELFVSLMETEQKSLECVKKFIYFWQQRL
jgi:hypothetical protein